MEHVAALLESYLSRYGYWTIAVALLIENAGIPAPGETVLLLASFLASSRHELRLPYIILVGTVAATSGDNIGYAIGRRGGRWLLDRYRSVFRIGEPAVERGERFFERFGPAAVFLARFIFGMRVIAGPLAGVLRMRWSRFAIFNLLGATTWVTAVSLLGYTFGQHWEELIPLLRNVNVAVAILVAIGALTLWWRHRKEPPGQRGE